MYHSSLFLAHSLLTVPVAFTSASVMSSNQILVSNPIYRMPTEIDAVVCRSAAKRSQAVLHAYIYVRLAGALAAAADVESSG